MTSYDPDDDGTLEVNPDSPGIQIHDMASIDTDRALDLLATITSELPGGGEVRPGQRAMVERVVEAFSTCEHAIIEAGTGVGKSLAYLIPAALAGRRVVIATATKNLQDQLASKDAPIVVNRVRRSSVAVLKGKQNYLCRNKAADTRGGAQLSFDDQVPVPQGVAVQVRRLLSWADDTETGDRDEVPFEVDQRAWRSISVTAQECVGRASCPQGLNCFHELAKDAAAASSLVIVNTHLYASHLSSGSMLLPEHDLVVFDEAHELPDIFAALLGTSLSPSRLRAVATTARPVLGADWFDRVDEFVALADRLASVLERHYDAEELTGLSEDTRRELLDAISRVSAIVEGLRRAESPSGDAEARKARALGPAIHLQNDLAHICETSPGELVFLTRQDRDVSIEVNLIDVSHRLREDLWGSVTAVLTSATIPDSLARQVGLDGVSVTAVPSPFDYKSHGLLYVPENFPTRNDPAAEPAIIDELCHLIDAAGGRTLALFTNRSVMNRVAEAVAKRIETPILVQGTLSRHRIIGEFRDDPAASLFAVTSFWQGVDVPGHSLSLVTIDRLPFSVPGDPIANARRERAANPFFEVDLPRAAMLLAQGVGRLIRSATDRGVVAVLDTRLAEAQYRTQLFKKLPPMKRSRDRAVVTQFLREIADQDR